MTIISLDIDDIIRKLKESAYVLTKANNDVSEIYLFGSLAKSEAVPGSDADILVILKRSDKRIIDRAVDFMDYFRNVGMGVDILCYTEKEIDEFKKEQRHFILEILAHAIRLV